ncbi:MAG TPA: hypothetical protein VKZ41_08105 [Gemmatimonadales bacterium]|nr:hypothetical protein [Gemmatimonadales bacterium]
MSEKSTDTATGDERLASFNELARRSSHEIRNALNAVAVNLEVARSRLERSEQQDDTLAKSVAPFARSAAEQLEVLAGLTESFMALARSGLGESVSLEAVVRNASRLADGVARSEGRAVTFDGGGVHGSRTVSGNDAGWVVVRLLLTGLAEGDGQSLTVGLVEGPRMFVRAVSGAELPTLDVGFVQAAAASGVQLTKEYGCWYAGFTSSGA